MNAKQIKWIITAVAIVPLVGLLWYVWPVKNPSWELTTMGTTAHITLSGSISKWDLKELRADIDGTLVAVNSTLSTWQTDSEISRFNRSRSLEGIPVSQSFSTVTRAALNFSKMTDGAFDPTVKPLVDYYGFGPEQQKEKPLAEMMETVGWKKLNLTNTSLRKKNPAVQLDFSAIAKGYGVDQVATVIAQTRADFLVEIGGEIVARGINPDGESWRVGIESPDPESGFGETIFQALELSDRAMATSGDYRNFQIRADGSRYSHIINPKTGKPAESDIAAVTVLADRCMDADAIATALFVMGSEKSFQWLENHPEFETFFILHTQDGFTSKSTAGFPTLEN
jgi:thiamine biosynthesis lipoprotein